MGVIANRHVQSVKYYTTFAEITVWRKGQNVGRRRDDWIQFNNHILSVIWNTINCGYTL